jgi:hypothetical protein
MVGAYSTFTTRPATPADTPHLAHAFDVVHDYVAAKDDPRPASAIPTSQVFSEGNGGEYRKSFHGYPKGYAQLIDSPTAWRIQPMQIDTWNRDYNGTGFKPGPLPRASQAPPGAPYSGLLECPCTTRVNRTWQITYATQLSGTCAKVVRNATECYDAAQTLALPAGAIRTNLTQNTDDLPAGCSVVADASSGAFAAVFNVPPSAAKGGVPRDCSAGAAHTVGQASIAAGPVQLSVTLNATSGEARLTLVGPAAVWFAVGFNASGMDDGTYAIVVNGTGGVFEQALASHAAGSPLTTSVTVVETSVSGGRRTVSAGGWGLWV